MTDGSNLESDVDPAELVAGFRVLKLFAAALRWYSSSRAFLFRFLRKKNNAPAIAATATTPTTTPAAIPATLGPLPPSPSLGSEVCVVITTEVLACDWPGAVTTIVRACVTTDAFAFCVFVVAVVGVGVGVGAELEVVLEVGSESSELSLFDDPEDSDSDDFGSAFNSESESAFELELDFSSDLEVDLESELEPEPDTLPGLSSKPVK